MQIQFTVIGDDLHEIADELEKLASQFRGQVLAAKMVQEAAKEAVTEPQEPAVEPQSETKKANKTKAKSAVEPQSEPQSEDDGDKSNPEADWKKATDILMKHWNENPDDAEKVLAVAQEFGVAKFRDIPTEKGTEFLAAAKRVVG